MLAEVESRETPLDKMSLKWAALDGVSLTVFPDIINGTNLSVGKFQENFFLRFGLEPLGIRNRYDVCGENLAVEHALQRPKGGFVVASHNIMAD